MMKLLQMVLVAAVLATGAMATINSLPETIDAGTTVMLKGNITCNATINNYGKICTENEKEVIIYGSSTIINHDDTQELVKLKNKPAEYSDIESITNVYEVLILDTPAEFDYPHITFGSGTVKSMEDEGITYRESTDLIHLMADSTNQKVSIIGGDSFES